MPILKLKPEKGNYQFPTPKNWANYTTLTGGYYMKNNFEKDDSIRLKIRITELEMRIDRLEDLISRYQNVEHKPFYSISEFADLMGVTPQTVYNKVHSGDISAVKIGKSWRIPYKNLQ